MDITYQSFRKEAEDLAQAAIETAIENGAADREEAEETAREYLHESVDGHEWVIYTGRAWEIVALIRGCDSKLWGEAHDRLTATDGDKIRDGEDLDAVITRLAYWLLLYEAESWLSSITIYSAGWNMPGYMPDSEPAVFTSFESAKASILESIENAADEMAQEIDETSAEQQEEAEIDDGKAWVEKQTSEFSVHVGKYVYWVQEV